jgi:hypothetical protein
MAVMSLQSTVLDLIELEILLPVIVVPLLFSIKQRTTAVSSKYGL